jgi:hypothetical protein
MRHANHCFWGAISRKHLRTVTLASGLLLSSAIITNSVPAFAAAGEGGAGSDNSAGEGNFDHSGIYTTLYQASGGDFGGSSSAAPAAKHGYYYLQGQGFVPIPTSRHARKN